MVKATEKNVASKRSSSAVISELRRRNDAAMKEYRKIEDLLSRWEAMEENKDNCVPPVPIIGIVGS